jgi:D-glycero-alpha-D-manno-heptose-7-phosphate kinase
MVIVRAPVRISFGGGGTDLEAYYARFGGLVVNATITRFCSVLARPIHGGGVIITSADYHHCEVTMPGELPAVAEPLILPKAAIERFGDDIRARGVELVLQSDVPPGTGLGSSSAMTVALVRALAAYLGRPLSDGEAAEAASWIEIERLGMPIGKQDQYASAFGGLNAIEFHAEGVRVSPLSLGADLLAALDERLLAFSTGRSRHSSDILEEQRAATASKPAVTESLHRIKALASEMCDTLMRGELDRFGSLLDRGWQEKKRLSGKISNADIDRWYAGARAAGALGGKITGAGGGGYLLLYCPPEHQAVLRATMAGYGLEEMPFSFCLRGAGEVAPPLEAEPLSAASDSAAVLTEI